MHWVLEDLTKKTAGYLRILRDGRPVADVFPFAANRDEKQVRADAAWLVEAANAFEPDDQENVRMRGFVKAFQESK